MGILRNIVLREYQRISTIWPNDYFCLIDFDIAGLFSAHAFLARIEQNLQLTINKVVDSNNSNNNVDPNGSAFEWDALACFGINIHPRKKWFPCADNQRVLLAPKSGSNKLEPW